MPTFLLYSLKAAGCLAVFYLFYKLLLSRDTLHRMNRVLLCGVLLLSFLLPLCVITVEKELPGVSAAGIDVIPENYFRRDMVFENRIPDDTRDLMIIEEPEPAPEPFDWGVLLGIIYFAGMFATLGWTVCNIVRVVRMTRRGQRIPLGNGSVLVLSDRIRAPFSWMRYVVMSEEDYACGGGTILVHEQAHQRLGHSWDLLLVDLLGCLQWFNPAMWLLRVELRAVHEYEADEQVLRCGVNAKDYQMLLIKKAVGGRWYSIANSLNHSNLKNRITMMLRKRSSRWARAKALYVLPLACLALGAFAQTSYVLPMYKTTKNSGNGEMPLPAGADGLTVGEGQSGAKEFITPESRECVVELLANLEQAAKEAKTIVPTAHTLSGRMFGPDDKPLSGFEFLCSGGRRVVTDADGRFTITSAQPVRLLYFDRRNKLFKLNGPFLDGADMEVEIRLDKGFELSRRRTGGDPILYIAEGDPSDWHFDRDRLPMLLYSGQELSPEFLQDFMALPQLQIYGRVVKDPEMIARYGTKSANGIVELNFEEGSLIHSWIWGMDEPWNSEWVELHLAWAGDAVSDVLQTRYEESWDAQLAADGQAIETHKPFSGFASITQSDDGQVWTLTVSESGKRWASLPFVPEAILYLIDGKEVSQADFYKRYPEEVTSVRLLKSAAAVGKYGKRGRCGAVEAASRRKSDKAAVVEKVVKPNPMAYMKGDFKPVAGKKGTYTVTKIDRRLNEDSDWDRIPLVLWDGRVVSIYHLHPSMAGEIETIRIIDDIDADILARYGTAARNGVISVVSKASLREGDREVTIYDRLNHPFRYLKGRFVSIDGRNAYKVSNLSLRNVSGTDPDSLPLVVVDDRVVPITTLGELPARKIETIQIFSSEDVFRNPALVERYGDAARVGAILVTTRDAAKQAEKEARKSGAGESVVASVPEGPSSGTVQTGNIPVDGQVKVRISEVAVPNDSLVVSGHDLSSMLFLLDGRRVAVAEVKALNEAEIESMSVLKDEWAVGRYGEAAADGVVYVTTTAGARQFDRLECSFERGNSFQEGPGLYRIEDTGNGFAIRPLNGARPLVLINGRQVDDDYLKSIDAGKVLWVRILQPGFELLDRYGERARDGVIEFTTNESGERTTLAVYSSNASGKTPNKMTVVREPSGASSGHSSVSKSIATSAQPLEETVTLTYTTGADSDSDSVSVSVVDNGRSLKQVGLIVLDGEEISADRLSQLDPSRIDAMTVLKGEQAVEHYGEKGAKGVIEITTKKNRSGVRRQ